MESTKLKLTIDIQRILEKSTVSECSTGLNSAVVQSPGDSPFVLEPADVSELFFDSDPSSSHQENSPIFGGLQRRGLGPRSRGPRDFPQGNFFEGVKHRRAAEQNSKHRKSLSAVCELLDSEREYASRLEHLRQSIAKPARMFLSRSEFASVFGNLDAVCTLSWTFLSELDHGLAAFTESSPSTDISGFITTIELTTASLFMQWRHPFKILAQYMINYDSALLTLSDMQRRKRRVQRYAQFWKCVSLFNASIESYLILPVQRLPRYVLLLGKLMSSCNNPVSLAALDQASEAIKAVTEYCNERKRECEQRFKALVLENCLGLEQQSPTSRRFVRETRAWIYFHASDSGTKPFEMEAWVVLFNDALVIKGLHSKEKNAKSPVQKAVKFTIRWMRKWGLSFTRLVAPPASTEGSCSCSPTSKVMSNQQSVVVELDLEKCHALPSVTVQHSIFMHDSTFSTLLTLTFVTAEERDCWLGGITQPERNLHQLGD